MDTDIFKNTNVKELVANIKKPLFGCKV